MKPNQANNKPRSEFEQNLQKGFQKEASKSADNNKESSDDEKVKIFENLKDQIAEVSTKKFQPKVPIFGRATALNHPKLSEIRLKFLLNGVESKSDIFFYLPDEVKNTQIINY
jgi:hypothetical protein